MTRDRPRNAPPATPVETGRDGDRCCSAPPRSARTASTGFAGGNACVQSRRPGILRGSLGRGVRGRSRRAAAGRTALVTDAGDHLGTADLAAAAGVGAEPAAADGLASASRSAGRAARGERAGIRRRVLRHAARGRRRRAAAAGHARPAGCGSSPRRRRGDASLLTAPAVLRKPEDPGVPRPSRRSTSPDGRRLRTRANGLLPDDDRPGGDDAGGAVLHLRLDRRAEGRDAQPREPAVERGVDRRVPRHRRRRPGRSACCPSATPSGTRCFRRTCSAGRRSCWRGR